MSHVLLRDVAMLTNSFGPFAFIKIDHLHFAWHLTIDWMIIKSLSEYYIVMIHLHRIQIGELWSSNSRDYEC